MKKLLFFSHGLSANGIETFLYNILGRLDSTKYDITVVIAIDEGESQLHEQEVLDAGIKVIHAGDLDGLWKKLAYIRNIKRILKTGGYDIVHSNMDLLNGITLHYAKRFKVPVRICHAHNSESQYAPKGLKAAVLMGVHKLYSRIMKKSLISSSTVLLSCSELAGKYFYSGHDFKIIYNGIDLEKFRMPQNFDRDGYSARLGMEATCKRIVSVGRLSMQKNPLFAMEIAAALKGIRDDFQYVWVGSGELQEETVQRARELGVEDKMVFTGVRTDVPQILNCCDCFLMPSLFEGLPFSLIEAQAAGLNCVVSDTVTTMADIGAVTYCPLSGSARDWAQLVSDTLDRPRPEINTEKAALFDVGNTVRQLEEIYDEA